MAYFLKFNFLLLVFAGALVWTTASASDIQYKSISETEKAFFALYQLSDATPSYAEWIEASPEYKNENSMYTRQEIYENESLRLKWGFAKYDPAQDPLKIKTDILLQLRRKGEAPTLNFKFTNSADEEAPYFPYTYGGEWLALFVGDLGDYTTITLNQSELEHVSSLLQVDAIYKAKVEMHIEPTYSNINQPVDVDGLEAWFMNGKVAHISFTHEDKNTNKEREIWSYSAN